MGPTPPCDHFRALPTVFRPLCSQLLNKFMEESYCCKANCHAGIFRLLWNPNV